MIIIILTVICLLISQFIKQTYKNTKKVILNKIAVGENVNPGKQLNILQLSDLHLEKISISPDHLSETLKNEKIDLIALTGDFLDHKKSIPKLVPYFQALSQLNAKYGMYAVLGNHDYMLEEESVQKLIKTMEQQGCIVLRNENTSIMADGKRVNIIGIDDFSSGHSNLESSYKKLQDGVNLVLTHDPNIVLKMNKYHFDYLLAGHFHGGQICYPKPFHLVKMGELVKMKIIKGLHELDGKSFYINEGLGQTGVNARLGSRPEITIHQLSLASEIAEALSAM